MKVLFDYRGSSCSDLFSVKNFIEKTLKKLNTYIDDKDLLFDIKLILSELVVNGALHGNCSDSHKKVYLKVMIDSQSIIIIVRDEGEGIDIEEIKCDSLSCSGRGLMIVEALTDKLILNNNEVIAIKSLISG
ncbi:ATP-binding protein [Peptoniphilus raoultii]|uniref:ATP-binding protein n=1 Tax=Peptoniphilus raoultii TaxID=1776387 RepID=UPI001FD6C776|nr:ATP-binding protein [Peptoniphilus raoultii]